jgi:hypothetical protein
MSKDNKNKSSTSPSKNIIKHSKWTPKEDEKLKNLAKLNNYKNWKQISNQIKGRSAVQCQQRWNKILQPGLVKGPWSAYEDKILIDWVKKNGPIKWTLCSNNIPGRTGKQCREHWNNVLNNNIKKGDWTSEEDFLIMNFYKKYNGSWKKLIEIFDKRTENSIKNRFFSQLRKIACYNVESKDRKNSAKIKLNTLLKYLDAAIIKTTDKFKKENNMNDKDIQNYLLKYEKKKTFFDKNGNNDNEDGNENKKNNEENTNKKNNNNFHKSNSIKNIKTSNSNRKIFVKKSSKIDISEKKTDSDENSNNINFDEIKKINDKLLKKTSEAKITKMNSSVSTYVSDNNKKFSLDFNENNLTEILKRKNTNLINYTYNKQNSLNNINNYDSDSENSCFDENEKIYEKIKANDFFIQTKEYTFMSKPSKIGGNGMNIVLPNEEK